MLGWPLMSRPLIGLSTSVTIDAVPERAFLNAPYLHAVQQAGGIPVLLPPHLDAVSRAGLLDRLDGLVLSGGGDVDPARYGDAPHPRTADVSPARDTLEIALVHQALERDTPVLAICRGIQVLNVALGGTLHQHLTDDPGGPVAHAQSEPRSRPTHTVKVLTEGTRLGRIVGDAELAVNSFHHQAVRRLGDGLREVAWAPDGLVEAVELAGDRLVVGVQWHPEDLVGHDAAARRLFAAVVDAARRRAARGCP
jgi:putative glutamine amidotransferase